jgi:hypothetical protein
MIMVQEWDREVDECGGLVAVKGMKVKECPMATFTDDFSKWLKDAKSLGVRIVEVPLPLPPGTCPE